MRVSIKSSQLDTIVVKLSDYLTSLNRVLTITAYAEPMNERIITSYQRTPYIDEDQKYLKNSLILVVFYLRLLVINGIIYTETTLDNSNE